MSDETDYWLTRSPELLGQAVREHYNKYIDELERRGILSLYGLALRRYYGSDHSGEGSVAGVTIGGEQGETVELTVNQYRSIVTSLLSLTTASRPAFIGTARDDSADAMAAVQLAEQIWEYELDRGVEYECVDAARRMLVLQEGAVGVYWHDELGDIVAAEPVPETDEQGQPIVDQVEQIDPTTGRMEMLEQPRMTERPIHAGELRVEAHSPYDVARDLGARSIMDLDWVVVRRRANRWDLAAIYPERRADILGAKGVTAEDMDRGIWTKAGAGQKEHTDQVYILELYAHRRPAVPNGRYARVIGDVTLEHGDLPYPRIPVVVASPEATIDLAIGASSTIDLLGPQQAYDSVISGALSTHDAYSGGKMMMAEGHDLSVVDITGGPSLLKYQPVPEVEKPGPLQMPQVSPQSLQLAETLQKVMQVLSAINSVTRGDPEASLKSGAALALVQSMSVQHNMPIQKAFATLLREVATRVIETYRAMAKVDRIIEVTGTDETRTVQSFVGSDLESVNSVRVELGNPLLRTIAGKKELADFYADAQRWPNEPPVTRAQHMAFMTSGRLAPIWRAGRSEEVGIREECEALARGEERPVLITDCHAAHIREHKALLDGRGRLSLTPQAIANIDAHITAHGAQWVTLTIQNPALLAATGQQPAPLPMAPGVGPMPGAPAANDNGAPQEDSEIGEPKGASAPPATGPAAQPKEPGQPGMPNMPMNPATGERAKVAQGGMQ